MKPTFFHKVPLRLFIVTLSPEPEDRRLAKMTEDVRAPKTAIGLIFALF